MRIAIVGGKLQGVEATYLAKKAGWEVVLFDRREQAQASRLADQFYCMDILTCSEEFISCLNGIDLILPALEDMEVLNGLQEISEITQIPLLFDPISYSISSSKCISNRLFREWGVPSPQPWPDCEFPILVKPSDRSGSEGVQVISTREELDNILSCRSHEDWIIEEYLEGASYSIEVIGFKGRYHVFQVTELEMDRQYDCKRVLAPAKLDQSLMKEFSRLAFKLAIELSLNGIMDVETILHKGELKVLEIDARLPSQTPTAVYYSTGINMVECLGYSFLKGSLKIPLPKRASNADNYVIYEHFSVSPEKIEACGEHVLSLAGPLSIYMDFFGADEVLTDYIPGKMKWTLTLITRGTSRAETWKKRNDVLKKIQERFRIPRIIDSYPLCINKGLKRNDSSQRERYRLNRATDESV